jgi:cytochrome b
VLPKILNTCAVLLADRGLAASQRALATFCSLHRLLLALCEHYGLWGAAAARLDAFLGSKAQVRGPAAAQAQAHSLRNPTPLGPPPRC